MLQNDCQMSPLPRLSLVWLICAFVVVFESAVGYSEGCEKGSEKSTGLCCGQKFYNPETATCCINGTEAEITHDLSDRISACCGKKAYNPLNEICCQSKVKKKTVANAMCCGKDVIDPKKKLCCGPVKKILNRTSNDYQCCGSNKFNTNTHQCTDNLTIQLKQKDQCDAASNKLWTDEHYCGTEFYLPKTEICCDGHRYPKGKNVQCCGVKNYSITEMMCCSGILYNLTPPCRAKHDVQCCGSILYTKNEHVCCSSEDKQLIYSKNTGFGCCGHLYYNTSLWSCWAGKLSPGKSGVCQDSILSLKNLETDPCENGPLQIGTVESVSQKSIVFGSMLKLHQGNVTVVPLPSPNVWTIPDHFNYLNMIPGKTYIFNNKNVFSDFNHHSILQSIHFIISKCKK